MIRHPSRTGRALLAPEVVQTSAMDCGPAALKCLLEGHGTPVSYGRLREACQIDLDGTSIDTIESVAQSAGLDAEQVMVPPDHLFLQAARCLPAVVVVRGPDGLTHFVVAWRRHGRVIQVMDPAIGRRWTLLGRFSQDLYIHRMEVPVSGWREWAGSEEFLGPLRARLHRLGITTDETQRLLSQATDDPSWLGLAALDASARMTASLVSGGALTRGGNAARMAASLLARCRESSDQEELPVSERYWTVRPVLTTTPDGPALSFRGTVLVRVRGRADAAPDAEPLSPELAAALSEPPIHPARDLLRLLAEDGVLVPGALAIALLVAGLGLVLEGLLFRAFFDLATELDLGRQRAAALGSLLAVIVCLALLDVPIVATAFRLGRRLELRLRIAFLHKLPRLHDRYLQSRLTSDMAERAHTADRLRLAPDLVEWLVRTASELLFTIGGIVWLDPRSSPIVITMSVLGLTVPLVLLPRIQELDLQVRSHSGALTRFHLDALLGLLAIRAHGARRAVLRQHDGLLAEWSRAYLRLQRAQSSADALVQAALVAMGIVLVFVHLARNGLNGGVLLLAYWAFKVVVLGQMLTLSIATQYPSHRNTALRLLEPLGAPEAPEADADSERSRGTPVPAGVRISWRAATVRAAGHAILEEVSATIEAGEHVAIVGASGAGKSSLLGTLLGWHRPASGEVLADDEPLAGDRIRALREATAWIDPGVQLWNRSLLENLLYGASDPAMSHDGAEAVVGLGRAIDEAQLAGVLRQLPLGLQTPLGESGGLVAGGEGQRVRFGRALLRPRVRLVLFDEPFRGLARDQRRELLQRARRLWKGATLLCVTHDVDETRSFDRVLVVDGGRIAEDGPPERLASAASSRYRALLDAEEAVRSELWESRDWRRLRMERGTLCEL